MTKHVTWQWIEESLFPLVIQDARRAGLDTAGWALDSREGPGRMLVKLNRDKAVETVLQRFTSPSQADRVMQGMRFAWCRVPETDHVDIEATDGSEVTAALLTSVIDGATLVQVDTSVTGNPHIRICLNDGIVFDGRPEGP